MAGRAAIVETGEVWRGVEEGRVRDVLCDVEGRDTNVECSPSVQREEMRLSSRDGVRSSDSYQTNKTRLESMKRSW